jgi:hypothetical protein
MGRTIAGDKCRCRGKRRCVSCMLFLFLRYVVRVDEDKFKLYSLSSRPHLLLVLVLHPGVWRYSACVDTCLHPIIHQYTGEKQGRRQTNEDRETPLTVRDFEGERGPKPKSHQETGNLPLWLTLSTVPLLVVSITLNSQALIPPPPVPHSHK